MIRKIEHHKQFWVKNKEGMNSRGHYEKHLITTWYFLFIPIYRYSELISSTM